LLRLISFLPLFCNCQFRILDSVQFLCSQAHIRAGWLFETRLDSTRPPSILLLPASDLFFITYLHVPRRKHNGEIGGMIGKGNRSTRRKLAPRVALSTTNSTCCPDANPGRCGWKPASNRLSYGTLFPQVTQHLGGSKHVTVVVALKVWLRVQSLICESSNVSSSSGSSTFTTFATDLCEALMFT
jgi:hypothetical protein